MKKVLSSKKLSRQNLKAIQGAGAGEICCLTSCDTGECLYWTQLPTKCPLFPVCQ